MGLYFIVWIETRVFECVRFSLNSESVKFNLESPLRFLMGIISIITWSVWDEGTVCSQENIQIFEEVWLPSSVIFFFKGIKLLKKKKEYNPNRYKLLNYRLSQKFKLLRNDKFNHLTIIITPPHLWD